MAPVIVLCGGLGTRLRDTVPDVPKVLAPVAGEPFLVHLLRHLARQGARRVILAAGVGGEQVEAVAGDGTAWGLEVTTAVERERLGTGGAVRHALDHAALDGPFFVINGDSWFTGDPDRLLRRHARPPAATATLALVRVDDSSRYGTVAFDPETSAVTAFLEKDRERSGPAWISAGFYLLSPAAVADIRPGATVSIERDVFPGLVGHGLRAVPYPDATFLDIGTPADYARAAGIVTGQEQ